MPKFLVAYNVFILVIVAVLITSTATEDEDPLGTCWDPELSFLMKVEPKQQLSFLQASAEAIKAKIRQEAAQTDDIHISEHTAPPYASTEDIKAQIRREALLHVAQVMGVPPHEVGVNTVDSLTLQDLNEEEPSTLEMNSTTNNRHSNSTSELFQNASTPAANSTDATQNEQDGAFLASDTDERTMLDIFGEQAKEFLTRKVIPETDTECSWDWRTLRCEPSCQCRFQPRRGDYHVGRSCRKLITVNEDCVPERPWNDHAAARRILSLAHQTTILLRLKVIQTIHEIAAHAKSHYEQVQDRVCPPLPCSKKTLPEKILCHRSCDEDDDNGGDEDDLPFTGRKTILTKLQNRFAFDPQQPTEDMGWEF